VYLGTHPGPRLRDLKVQAFDQTRHPSIRLETCEFAGLDPERVLLHVSLSHHSDTSFFGVVSLQPDRPTKEQYDRAAEGAKLLLEENRKFDSGHKLKGQVADTAVRQMQDEGYRCQIGYLDLPQLEKDGVTIRMVKTPRVFCALPSSQPEDVCTERRVTLAIAWQDPKATEAGLQSQLTSSLVTDRSFRCVPAGWVLR